MFLEETNFVNKYVNLKKQYDEIGWIHIYKHKQDTHSFGEHSALIITNKHENGQENEICSSLQRKLQKISKVQ